MRTMLRALAATAAVLAPAQTPGQPRLVVPAPHHDFGHLAPGVEATHRFRVRNEGQAPLHITRVRPSCGCTSTVVGAEVLAPGAATEIEVTFHTTGLVGHAQKTVEVFSDDPGHPSFILTFAAEVEAPATLAKDEVLFQDLKAGDRRQQSVRLFSGTRQPIAVTQVDLAATPWLGVATRYEGHDAWLDLDLLARNLPPGKLSGLEEVTLHLVNPMPSVLHLAVRWEKRPPVVAVPSQVAWAEAAGHELTASVMLTQPEGKPFRILFARTSNPALQVSDLAQTAAARQTVQVTLSGTATPGRYTDKVFLTLDTPGQPEFELRVSAVLR